MLLVLRCAAYEDPLKGLKGSIRYSILNSSKADACETDSRSENMGVQAIGLMLDVCL